jgi:long-subunit fatty acid transport protein
MKNRFLVFVLAISASTFSFAQNNSSNSILSNSEYADKLNTITTAVPFLMIAPDARGGGMGDAGVSTSADANSMHWNPAKYAFIEKDFGAAVSYSPWLRGLVNDINLAYLGLYKRINERQVVAASLLYFSLGNINFTDEQGNDNGSYKPNEFAVDACYSYKFTKNFSGGIAMRYIYSNLTGGAFVGGAATKAGNSVAADVSIMYNKPLEIGKQTGIVGFGLNISNIGAKISYTENLQRDFIPINLRLGPSFLYNFDKNNSLTIAFDLNKLLVPTPPDYYDDSINPDTGKKDVILKGKNPNVGIVTGMIQSFYDAPGGFNEEINEINFALGLEYWYAKQFSVRTGYFHEASTKGNRKYVTLGAGLRYSVFGLDFAYLLPVGDQHSPLENTLRFTLHFDFNKVKGKKEATE